MFTQSNDTWKQAGGLSSNELKEKFDSAMLEGAQVAKPDWSDMLIEGKRFRVQLNQH